MLGSATRPARVTFEAAAPRPIHCQSFHATAQRSAMRPTCSEPPKSGGSTSKSTYSLSALPMSPCRKRMRSRSLGFMKSLKSAHMTCM